MPNFTRYTINEDHTVGRGAKPPYTKSVKYDLNEPSIKWSIGYGDDPELAARGITGTGVPGIVNSVILTESGLLFGAGHDQQIRAWDTDTGKELWFSRFGGSFTRSSPVMYEMSGKQYMLLPAAASAPAGTPAAPSAPMGWIAYALPGR